MYIQLLTGDLVALQLSPVSMQLLVLFNIDGKLVAVRRELEVGFAGLLPRVDAFKRVRVLDGRHPLCLEVRGYVFNLVVICQLMR